MTLVSIDIGAMEDLIADLGSAREAGPQDASTIRVRMDHVLLGHLVPEALAWTSPIWPWIDDRIRDLHRRLALARLIAASTPGIPATGVVQIDESYICDLTAAEIDSLVAEVVTLMDTGEEYAAAQDIDPRLLEILDGHAHDPYFAQALASTVSPQDLDGFLRRVNGHRQQLRLPEDATAFDQRYDQLLNGLGMAFGLASQGTGELAVPGMTQAWTQHVRDVPPMTGTAHRLNLVLSRGTFSTDLLISMHDTLRELEGDRGPEFWAVGGLDWVYDPDLAKSPGANLLMDPMGALFQGMGANPEAMRQLFGTGPTVPIETDDGTEEVNAYLWAVLRERGQDEYAVEQLLDGLAGAVSSPPVEGQPAWQPGLAEDLGAIGAAFEREARIAEENRPPWWSRWGHSLLDLAGMIPALGEVADGINALWYLGEGDHPNAAISAAGMVPFVGWFAVGGRWVRRALSPDELARVGRLADSGTDLRHFLPGGRVGTGAAMRDPASFTPDQFLSSGELRRLRDRPWLQRMMAGNRFDSYMAPNYPHNQVYIVNPNGGYFRLDSYVPGEAIVSRKLTQLGNVSPRTARGYVDELLDKYPDGGVIADVPSTRASGIAGDSLRGDLILEVPPQLGGQIPHEVAEYAHINGIRIVDVNGFDYTAYLLDIP